VQSPAEACPAAFSSAHGQDSPREPGPTRVDQLPPRENAAHTGVRTSAQRVTNEQVWSRHPGGARKAPQLAGDLGRAVRQFFLVAPARSRAVVDHGCRKQGDPVVDVQIVDTEQAGPMRIYSSRAPGARVLQRQVPTFLLWRRPIGHASQPRRSSAECFIDAFSELIHS
jgi:hypothetical protein